MQATTIGLDLAKNIFQVHGLSLDGDVAFNRSLRRGRVLEFFERPDPCLVGIDACAGSHYWARELVKLGHNVRLIPPAYVKPYVKRGKSDAVDAEAICEAVGRPTMRFVAIKTPEQQAMLSLHRARDLIVRQRTQVVNTLRGLLGEFGHVLAQGVDRAIGFARQFLSGENLELPALASDVVGNLCHQLLALCTRLRWYALKLAQETRQDARVNLLRTIPGVGPITATAIVATIGTADQFRNGREFAAWLGLTPLNRSSGGKERLGRISKMGDKYLRRLLVIGMTSRVRRARSHPERADPWLLSLVARKPARVTTVAMANKTARMVWAVLRKNEPYRPVAA